VPISGIAPRPRSHSGTSPAKSSSSSTIGQTASPLPPIVFRIISYWRCMFPSSPRLAPSARSEQSLTASAVAAADEAAADSAVEVAQAVLPRAEVRRRPRAFRLSSSYCEPDPRAQRGSNSLVWRRRGSVRTRGAALRRPLVRWTASIGHLWLPRRCIPAGRRWPRVWLWLLAALLGALAALALSLSAQVADRAPGIEVTTNTGRQTMALGQADRRSRQPFLLQSYRMPSSLHHSTACMATTRRCVPAVVLSAAISRASGL
jgi:hypothetical protein